ncbi:MAG: metal-dependent hydrolase [Thermoguttaceae bacterium]
MAGFKTHMTISTLAGAAYGGAAYAWGGVPAPACLLAGGLCSVSGMLPDIDSGPGRPLRESLSFAAAVISTMMVDRFQQFGWPMESIILAAAGVYLVIRFGLAELLRRFTVHRGMFHSLPAAVIAGEVAFLLASGQLRVRIFKAGAVAIGYLSHLLVDELYSIGYVRGRMKLKRSFGTGLKLFGKGWTANALTYLCLGCLTLVALKEPGWMQKFYQERLRRATEQWAERIVDYSGRALAQVPGLQQKLGISPSEQPAAGQDGPPEADLGQPAAGQPQQTANDRTTGRTFVR